jgi:ATP-dependent helicase/nuclease subunit B
LDVRNPPIQRVPLGLTGPTLPAAAAWLLERAQRTTPGEADLSGAMLVLPGSRAQRALLGLLVEGAERAGLGLTPPRFLTPGSLAGVLLKPGPLPRVSEPGRLLAWAEALKRVPRAERAALWPESVGQAEGEGEAGLNLGLAALLDGWHRALAGEGLSPAELIRRAQRLPDWPDEPRWRAIDRLRSEYAAVLRGAGRADADLDRLDALEQGRLAEAASEHGGGWLVLVAVPELSGLAKSALAAALHAGVGPKVTALVAAEEGELEGFDEFGCVRAGWWAERGADLRGAVVRFAQTPRDQAREAMAALLTLAPRHDRGSITLGLADPELAADIERAASATAGVPVHLASGRSLEQAGPVVVLRLLADWLETRGFGAFMALVRHPLVEAWLQRLSPEGSRPAWWLTGLDDFARAALPATAEDLAPSTHPDEGPDAPLAAEFVLRQMGELLAPFGGVTRPEARERAKAAMPVAATAAGGLAVLAALLGDRRVHRREQRDAALLAACEAVADAAAGLSADADAVYRGTLPPARVLRLMADQAAAGSAASDPAPGSLEALGWLELALDPAPAAVVVGMNEGRVPGSPARDGLLTESLRRAVGLPDAASRAGRDAYLLHALAASTRDLVLIAGRLSASGDPLWPSRLLLPSPGPAQAQRVLTFLGKREQPAAVVPAPRWGAGQPEADGFRVGVVVPAEPVRSMRVTDFRLYLRSPYAYYLQRVLGLEEVGPVPAELEADRFGTLVHEALAAFGRHDERHTSDADRIFDLLDAALTRAARQMLGSRAAGTVINLQLEHARQRLRAFASWQAQEFKDGWRLTHAEWSPPGGGVTLTVDGEPFRITGRIDRIDVNTRTGRARVLDYKTGDNQGAPNATHRRGGQWVDLQLPLYRELVAPLGLAGGGGAASAGEALETGYIALGASAAASPLLLAKWDQAELEGAMETAHAVVRAVRAGAFAELGDAPDTGGAIAYLCGLGFAGGGEETAGGIRIGAAEDSGEADGPDAGGGASA